MRQTAICPFLMAMLLESAAAADGLPAALYCLVDDRGIITWSNQHTDERLQLSETPAYSGILTYTVGAAPSQQRIASDNQSPVTATEAEIDAPPGSETPQDR